ncbi:MAG: hypothetical protein IJ650_07200 [Paludibacteraceae bacterium]|nr:hypothetical protein [Paludibacteraceae bacterium]
MIPANAKLLICPFCKGEKPIIQLVSGNTCGATQRSDLKVDYPMLPRPSYVQRCPHCGKYYFITAVETKEASFRSGDKGELSYREAAEALQQLTSQPIDQKDEINLLLLYIQAYNTTYQLMGKDNQPMPTEEEHSLFCEQVERLLAIWEVEPLVKAEFLREIGQFDDCIKILDTQHPKDFFKYEIATRIRSAAQDKSTKVFIITQR